MPLVRTQLLDRKVLLVVVPVVDGQVKMVILVDQVAVVVDTEHLVVMEPLDKDMVVVMED
tara:strand:- start:242 stop:421 length:180 start_codon:yes stop_codon:yes gene_type:complete